MAQSSFLETTPLAEIRAPIYPSIFPKNPPPWTHHHRETYMRRGELRGEPRVQLTDFWVWRVWLSVSAVIQAAESGFVVLWSVARKLVDAPPNQKHWRKRCATNNRGCGRLQLPMPTRTVALVWKLAGFYAIHHHGWGETPIK